FSPTEHELLLTFHHIIADGWSLALFVHELVACYGALVSGTPPELPALTIQYGDYAIWQNRLLDDPGFAHQRDFWKAYLPGSEPTSVPADYARNRTASRPGARLRMPMSAANTQALRAVVRESHATLYMALLAAFDIALFRLTGRSDLVIGSPTANRIRP